MSDGMIQPKNYPKKSDEKSWRAFFANEKKAGANPYSWLELTPIGRHGNRSKRLWYRVIPEVWGLDAKMAKWYLVHGELGSLYPSLENPSNCLTSAGPEINGMIAEARLESLARVGEWLDRWDDPVAEPIRWLDGGDQRTWGVIKSLITKDEKRRRWDRWERNDPESGLYEREDIAEALEWLIRIPNIPEKELKFLAEYLFEVVQSVDGQKIAPDYLKNAFKEVMGGILNQAQAPEVMLEYLDGHSYFNWMAATLAKHPRLGEFKSWQRYVEKAVYSFSSLDFDNSDRIKALQRLIGLGLGVNKIARRLHRHLNKEWVSIRTEELKEVWLEIAQSGALPPKIFALFLLDEDKEVRMRWMGAIKTQNKSPVLAGRTHNSVLPKRACRKQ